MKFSENVTGIQHIGLPTKDMAATAAFYESLGFEAAFETTNNKDAVKFFRLKNIIVEAYESGEAADKPGAIDHIALDVTDVEAAYACAKANGYNILNNEIQFLPFWKNGVRFFTILGPNKEKVEFSQML